jgi:hypothetical protein
MVFGRMVFGVVVGEVVGASGRQQYLDQKLSLTNAVLYPVKAHVHGFGSTLFDCIVGETRCSGVIGLHWGWWLWMSKLVEYGADGHGFLTVDEQPGQQLRLRRLRP